MKGESHTRDVTFMDRASLALTLAKSENPRLFEPLADPESHSFIKARNTWAKYAGTRQNMELYFSASSCKAKYHLQDSVRKTRNPGACSKGKAYHGKPRGRRRAGWCRSCILSGPSCQVKILPYQSLGQYHIGKPAIPGYQVRIQEEMHVIKFRNFSLFTCARSLARSLSCSTWDVASREKVKHKGSTGRDLSSSHPQAFTELLSDPEAYLADHLTFAAR